MNGKLLIFTTCSLYKLPKDLLISLYIHFSLCDCALHCTYALCILYIFGSSATCVTCTNNFLCSLYLLRLLNVTQLLHWLMCNNI